MPFIKDDYRHDGKIKSVYELCFVFMTNVPVNLPVWFLTGTIVSLETMVSLYVVILLGGRVKVQLACLCPITINQ